MLIGFGILHFRQGYQQIGDLLDLVDQQRNRQL